MDKLKHDNKKAPLNWAAHGADEGWFGNLPSSHAYFKPKSPKRQDLNISFSWSFQVYQDPADLLRVLDTCEKYGWWHLWALACKVMDRMTARKVTS